MSTFFTRSGGSPPRRPPVKRAFSGLVGRFDATQEIPPRFIGRSFLQAIPIDVAILLDGRTSALPMFTMTAEQIRKTKYDEKMRQKALKEKMVKLVALAYPKSSKAKRNRIVEDALKDETLTAWDLNRMLKAVVEHREQEQMFASALTNPDGTKDSDSVDESHRHPIYASGAPDSDRAARERVFDRDGAAGDNSAKGKHQDANAIKLINNWRTEIHAVADHVIKTGGDLITAGYTYKGVTMRLCTWLAFLELFPEDDPDRTRQMIAAFLSDDSDAADDQGHRRHVVPRGTNPKHYEDNDEEDNQTSFGFKVVTGERGNLELPEETDLGKEITKQTRALVQKEILRKEVEDFYKRNEPVDLSPTSCPACIKIDGVLYHCQMDRSHRGTLGGLFENRVVGTDHQTFVPNPDPEDSRPVPLWFSDESVGKLLETQNSL